MSYINNMNPRRMIWFNQNAPKNKMDLWLSYNRHYEDTSEDETTDAQETTDNPSQRNCDLILKAWDCGKWVPIVGFNTTAANKIDTVEGTSYTPTGESQSYSGKTLYHPAIFTDESPNELYDAGSLGELLKDTHFVTEEDWEGIYDTYLKTIIEQYPFELWRAKPTELGGICANTFETIAADGFAECKFYNSTNNKLYVSGVDILAAISESQGGSVDPSVLYRSFYNSPTILKGWTDDPLTALKPRFELSGSRVVENRGKIPMLRDDDWWETHGSGYTGNYDDTNSALVWVDLPEGTEYTAGVGIYIPSGKTINIQTSGASNNYDLLSYNGSGDVKWVELSDDGITTTRMLVGNQIVISSTNKDTIYVPDASGNVLISTTVSTESSGNYKFKEHCVYKPQVLGPSGTSLHYLTIVNNDATVVNKSYVRFKTSSLEKPMLYFNKDTKYIPSYSVSGVTATYDSTGNTNYIQLEESTDYLLDIMFDYIKLEKIIDVSNS